MARSQKDVEKKVDETLKRMLETPPRPHNAEKKGGKKKGGARRQGRPKASA